MVCSLPKNPSLLLIAVFCGIAFATQAQIVPERCGSVAYDKIRKQHRPALENKAQFEKWMKDKISHMRLNKSSRTQTTTYTIPVVVHIIYNKSDSITAAQGGVVGTYISDAQVQSQIDVLNADFPRLNTDAVNTPAEFLPVAAGMDLQFVLAKQDPEGLPTNGILRVRGTKSGWQLSDNSTFKALSYWPAENYLNLWVLKFTDPTGLIGYAQLPVSDLPGLENSSDDRLTDGVAIDFRAFGVGFPELYSTFNKGRTATHEIGHIFGLRHIWGDEGGCASTDYCDDTPIQDASTDDCPAQPAKVCSPLHDKMFQNYMDYTYDVCMNLFTADQVDRMVTVVTNSPRRASLLVSPGATEPVALPNDLGIKRVISPVSTSCRSVTPSIEIRNYGTNAITSASIQLSVNGSVVETKDINSLSLAPLDSVAVGFSPINNLSFQSVNEFKFIILETNGIDDGKASNDTLIRISTVPAFVSLPLFEQFNTTPSTWSIVNPDGLTTWQNVLAPTSSATNKGMYLNYYDYLDQDEEDKLVSPIFDFSNDTAALLKFDRAYAALSATSNADDRLRVLVATGCDFSHATEVFNLAGSALATTTNTSQAFVPNSSEDWKTETISLTSFLGQPNVQIAFVGTNEYGNNLYLDNVRVIIGNYTDVVLTLKSPSPVSCELNPTPVISLKNNGSTIVTDFTVNTTVNSGPASSLSFSGLHIDTGEEFDFNLNPWTLNSGANVATIVVENANEVFPNDNVISLNEIVNDKEVPAPLRENFDGTYTDWTIVSETTQTEWVSAKTNKSTSLVYGGYTNASIGNKSWLVSPTIDFSKAAEASLFFDLSYAKSTTGSERLQILLSTDCGLTFPYVVFDQTGEQFAETTSGAYWTPTTDSDWKRIFVNLDTLAGQGAARIAFVVTNDHGNNLYIDNIEIYTDDDSTPIAINTLYSVYNNNQPIFKVTFNLPESELVHLQIYNTIGQIVVDNLLPNTLNQTYDIDMSEQQAGIYIVRLQMGTQLGTAKVFVPH